MLDVKHGNPAKDRLHVYCNSHMVKVTFIK